MKNSPPLYARLAGWAVACAMGAAATAVCAQNAPAPAKTLRMAINNDLKVVDPLLTQICWRSGLTGAARSRLVGRC